MNGTESKEVHSGNEDHRNDASNANGELSFLSIKAILHTFHMLITTFILASH